MKTKKRKAFRAPKGLKRRKVTAKGIKESQRLIRMGTQWLLCSNCQQEEIEVTGDVSRVICSICVQRMVPPPVVKQVAKKKTSFPRGWHFMKRFVAPDGTVYERGKPTGETSTAGKPISKAKAGKTSGKRKRTVKAKRHK